MSGVCCCCRRELIDTGMRALNWPKRSRTPPRALRRRRLVIRRSGGWTKPARVTSHHADLGFLGEGRGSEYFERNTGFLL